MSDIVERLRRWRDVGDGPMGYTAGDEQFASDVVALLAERDRLRDALLQIASSGVDGESLNLSRVGHAGCINVAKDALGEDKAC